MHRGCGVGWMLNPTADLTKKRGRGVGMKRRMADTGRALFICIIKGPPLSEVFTFFCFSASPLGFLPARESVALEGKEWLQRGFLRGLTAISLHLLNHLALP